LNSPGKNSPALKILGIDPGSIACGYGLITTDGINAAYVTSGRICPPPSKPLHQRLRCIYEALTEVIRVHDPDDIVVEKMFFAKGVKAALSLGHARGIVLLAAATGGIALYECSALEVKKAVVGYGRAEKSQVQEMVRLILNVKEPLYPDSADALALALCHVNAIKFREAVNQGKKQEVRRGDG
jgi:crossover junction endodeoxyribonuclease RuvC